MLAAIVGQGRTLAKRVEVELDEDQSTQDTGWGGWFEAPGDWPEDMAGPFRLCLFDGRVGEFVTTRACGAELGGSVVQFRGTSELASQHYCGHGR